MTTTAAPEAAPAPEAAASRVFGRRRSLDTLAGQGGRPVARRRLAEDPERRLSVAAFNSSV